MSGEEMPDVTCIYYTSNREKPEFENRIRQSLLDGIGDMPLISVSQKPIEFGKNICVGDVGASSQNAWRQFQIGAMEAKTKFVCTAEADFLYPPEYFKFIPKEEKVMYIAKPMFVLFARKEKVKVFWPKKSGSFGALFTDRENIVKAIEHVLEPLGTWGTMDEKKYDFSSIYRYMKLEFYDLSAPIVSFITGNGMHRGSPRSIEGVTRLPYWGKAVDLINKYMSNEPQLDVVSDEYMKEISKITGNRRPYTICVALSQVYMQTEDTELKLKLRYAVSIAKTTLNKLDSVCPGWLKRFYPRWMDYDRIMRQP